MIEPIETREAVKVAASAVADAIGYGPSTSQAGVVAVGLVAASMLLAGAIGRVADAIARKP